MRKNLEGQILTPRAIRGYHAGDPSDNQDDNQQTTSVERVNQPDNHRVQTDNQADNHDNQSDNQRINPVDRVKSGQPPIIPCCETSLMP